MFYSFLEIWFSLIFSISAESYLFCCWSELRLYHRRLRCGGELRCLSIVRNMCAGQVCLCSGESMFVTKNCLWLKDDSIFIQKIELECFLDLQKITCATAGLSCGTITDDCGSTISCGQCPSTDECIMGQCACISVNTPSFKLLFAN
jgi:hypothetical protein